MWLNVFIQGCFLLIGSAVLARAASISLQPRHAVTTSNTQQESTVVYILQPNETVTEVALRYHSTVEELQQLIFTVIIPKASQILKLEKD
ncbi:hypothetical protein BB936_21645 (plasmid) [Yersinia enterocolitica]|nr:hypothetical protein BB936_21645 [Yersinia enterocolitica]